MVCGTLVKRSSPKPEISSSNPIFEHCIKMKGHNKMKVNESMFSSVHFLIISITFLFKKTFRPLSTPGRQRDAILIDNLETKSDSPIAETCADSAYYKETDFAIGKEISVVGRNVLLYDCDEFTRKFYRLNHNKGT